MTKFIAIFLCALLLTGCAQKQETTHQIVEQTTENNVDVLKSALENALAETTIDIYGNPTSVIFAYGDINCDDENEFFIGNWNVSATSSLCEFRLYSEDGIQLVDSEFYSMDNTPFSAVYYDAENETYIAENSYFLKDTDGAEIQRVQRLVCNDEKWNIETEDIDSATVQTHMGEQIDVDFSVIKISDINDIDKVLEGINDEIVPQALTSDDTANPLIFIETQTPCDPDTELQMDFEYASTLLHDELEADGKFPEGAIILDDGAYEINGTIYHCLAVCSDNGENISRMGNFCVSDTDRTAVYICFDPTIDRFGMFADYAGAIDEDDGRTRLIKITDTTQTTAVPAIPSDEKIIEMFNSAEELRSAYFFNDDNGSFLTKDGRTIEQYRDEFSQLFTDRFAEEFFELYGYEYSYYISIGVMNKSLEFVLYNDDVNYRIETHGSSFDEFKKLDFSNIGDYAHYDAITIGGGKLGSDISIVDHELRITEKSADKITLTMTVWHCVPPDYEKKINEDYIYRIENGKLVIEGLFGGWTEDRNAIILDSELAGTIAEDITETSEPNYLVNYEYNMVIEDGLWKFDSYPEWY